MLRRNFLQQMVLTVGAATAAALGCCPQESCKTGYAVTIRNVGLRKHIAEVTAPKEELHRFVLAFQTNLWPNWRTDSTSFGRKTQRHMQLIADNIDKNGKILCDVSLPVLVDAFMAALPANRAGVAFSFSPGEDLTRYFHAIKPA